MSVSTLDNATYPSNALNKQYFTLPEWKILMKGILTHHIHITHCHIKTHRNHSCKKNTTGWQKSFAMD